MNRAGSFNVDDDAPSASQRPGLASWYTPGLSDVLGDRLLMFDNSTASSLELLRFNREFSSSPEFEAALRQRLHQLENFAHPSFGRVRAVQWLGAGQGLALISNQIPGRRLSEILREARGPDYALELVRQLTPALAALHEQSEGIAHGLLTPDRIVVTPEGRLVIVEHVLGSALESLSLPVDRLRSELGLVTLDRADGEHAAPSRQRDDLAQLGMIALSLVAGRFVSPDDYPGKLTALLDELSQPEGQGSLMLLRLRWWLEHALQLDGRTFGSASEAQDALLELPEESDMQPAELKPFPSDIQALPAAPGLAPGPEPAVGQETAPPPAMWPAVPPTPPAAQTARPRGFLPWSTQALRWAVLTLAAVTLVEAGVIGAMVYRRIKAAPVPPPLLLVESDIPGTQLMVDGKRSATPVMLSVSPGMKAIHLLAAEPANAATAVSPEPASATGQVEVTSDPAGAHVTVDGTRRGVTPLTLPLPPGQHVVIVSDGTTNTSRTVSVVAGTTTTVMAAMVPAGVLAGWLTITAPFELQVFEGGTLIGTTSTPRLMLAAGHHDLELKNVALGFDTKSAVEIQAGKTLTTPVAVPNGSLSVNALPWATVLLDGKEIGTTPVANLEVPLGTHELVFRHPQFGERRQAVVVTAKAPVRVVLDLRK